MGHNSGWTPKLEVIIDTGKFGDTKAIRGDGVDFVCREAETYMRMIIEAGLPFCLEVNAPPAEHDQIHAHLNGVAASLGKQGYPSLEALRAAGG
ncbi:hypothetical protein ASF34_01065 [Methylobacterium sp. Leaf106]|nr:hypothetical protein ASF34_01065 [Methylobacterium sp. Leaf106]